MISCLWATVVSQNQKGHKHSNKFQRYLDFLETLRPFHLPIGQSHLSKYSDEIQFNNDLRRTLKTNLQQLMFLR